MEEENHGYDALFIEQPKFDALCSICLFTLKRPVQVTPCGHRFCNDCIERLRRSCNDALMRCPNDQQEIQSTFRDNGIERDISNLEIKCSNNGKGCNWTSSLGELEKHEEECRRFLLECGNKCGTTIPRDQMSKHVKEQCKNTIHPCKYNNIGCPAKGTRSWLEEHEETNSKNHLSQAVETLRNHEERIEKQENQSIELKECKTQIAILSQKFEYLYKLKSQEMHRKSFTYTIKGFENKFQSARTNNDAILTEIFHCLGEYRLNMEIYLNGYNAGRKSHMSVYFRILKGPFDDVLEWPFKAVVTLSVKGNHTNDVIKMKFDITKKSQDVIEKHFHKPTTTNGNDSYGFHKVLSHNLINRYVMDDTLPITFDVTPAE